MKKAFFLFAGVILVLGISGSAFAEGSGNGTEDSHNININIETFALLAIESTRTSEITLAPKKPTEAGFGYDFKNAKDQSLWLNYSSVVAKDETRTITVAATKSNLPEGLYLQVEAKEANTTNGKGELGEAVSEAVTLSETAKEIVNEIGSCYTGNGHKNGRNLIYSLNMDNDKYKNLFADDKYQVTVTYTITE